MRKKSALKTEDLVWSTIGHEFQKLVLEKSLKSGRLPHAWIFSGSRNVGKTSLALDFAKILLCNSFERSRPCGDCNNCRSVKGGHPDMIVVDQEGEITVDQIRRLQRQFVLKSFMANAKVAVISSAENLNQEAANAFLKLLEEPTSKTHFILTTSNLDRILPTVLSRCQKLFFGLSGASDFARFSTAHVEGRDSAMQGAVAMSYGRLGLLRRLMIHPEFAEQWIASLALLRQLLSCDLSEKLKISQELAGREGEEIDLVLFSWLLAAETRLLASQSNAEAVREGERAKAVWEAAEHLRLNLNTRLVFDNLVLQI
ncbi:MAG: AAA family ATPase [Candidatus Doudnabacteria bacterium]|nr:AAA family ATPase [Candidatus Doudnabacteria bacterium]